MLMLKYDNVDKSKLKRLELALFIIVEVVKPKIEVDFKV